MKVKTWRDVFVYAVVMTAIALVVAVGLEARLLDRPLANGNWKSTVMIGGMVAFPMFVFVAHKLMRINRLSAELQRLVDRDRLTDVGTRDFFFEQIAQRGDSHGVSLMVDIDHFKQINDTFGHIAGDYVIQHIARILKDGVRKDDIVARFGGEEFMVFLQGQSLEEAKIAAERMRACIADADVPFAGEILRVTVSIGGAKKLAKDDIDQIIQAADVALYQAKEAGRNQTVFVGEEAERPD